MASIGRMGESIPAIRAGERGKTFVWYGDCCSGVPGTSREQNFAAVNAVFRRLEPLPDAVMFLGDNIDGKCPTAEEYRAQWRYWIDHEMDWFHPLDIPMHHLTSNHNTAGEYGETVFREVFADLPQNGPDGQNGLAYWVRDGEFLCVFVNTNLHRHPTDGHVEHEWLDRVLSEHADAVTKIVFGHHPVWPVNGHWQSPLWRIEREEGRTFWEVLIKHRVFAYVCSHVLAFDVQVHDGILQVTSGGAGTDNMPLRFMPRGHEYLHLIQAAIADGELRYQVLDTAGSVREWLCWPEPALALDQWNALADGDRIPNSAVSADVDSDVWLLRFRFTGHAPSGTAEKTMISGFQWWEGPEAIRVAFEGSENRLVVQLVPQAGEGPQRWIGPAFPAGSPLNLEVIVHSGMGPGGVLARIDDGPLSTLDSLSAHGAAHLAWPEAWHVGRGPSGDDDRPFNSNDLAVQYQFAALSLRELLSR